MQQGRYAPLSWHAFARSPGGAWAYLGAMTEKGAAHTCALVRIAGGQAFQAHDEFLGVRGARAIAEKARHIQQQLNAREGSL